MLVLVLVLVLASFCRTCKLGRRKHKHKRKERKVINSDKLSAYILVNHALLLRLRMLPYRTCKHPCAYVYAYACVVCVKPGLQVRRKHKNKHKHKHKDVYTCDKHKHNVTYSSAEANKFGAIAQPGCLLARDLIST